jgi:hypothetical protein
MLRVKIDIIFYIDRKFMLLNMYNLLYASCITLINVRTTTINESLQQHNFTLKKLK